MVTRNHQHVVIILLIALLLSSQTRSAFAAITQEGINNAGVLDEVLERFHIAAESWRNYLTETARFIFWSLAAISLTWTFGSMLLKRSELQEFFAEFIRFCMFLGIFKWLLEIAPDISEDVFSSFRSIAANASGMDREMTPSSIVDIGFSIVDRMIDDDSLSIGDKIVGGAMSIIVLIVSALISINILILIICSWIMSYAGIVLLGFGGSRWTSDIAVSYYKAVLGIATQLMTMTLIVGIGNQFINEYYAGMGDGSIAIKEMAVLMVASISLLYLTDKIPGFVSGIAGGPSAPQFGQSHVVSAAGAAMGAIATGGAAAMAGLAAAGGGAKAVMAAAKAGASNVDAGTDVLSSFGKSKGGSDGGSPGASAGSTAPASSGNSAIPRAAKIAVDAGANLASTTWSTAKQAAGNRIDRTIGGKAAMSIKEKSQSGSGASSEESGRKSSFQGLVQPINTLGGSKPEPIDADAEAAAFINKNM